MRRAKVSTPPPGDTGTTMRIGRLGKTACARTIPGASTTPAVARSDEIASRRFVEMVLNWMPFPLILSRAERSSRVTLPAPAAPPWLLRATQDIQRVELRLQPPTIEADTLNPPG